MATGYKQDLPPEGGYRPITYHRIPAKQLFRGSTLFAGFISLNGLAMYYYFSQTRPKVLRLETEKRGAFLACLPLLAAERDRKLLLQLRINRDAEEQTMAEVPGWEVGKLNGENVYKTVGDDELVLPGLIEYCINHTGKAWDYRRFSHVYSY